MEVFKENKMQIRKAKIEDSARIKEPIKQLGYDLTVEQVEKKVKAYLSQDMYEIFVAEEKGIVLGCITTITYESFCFKNGCCMHIETLIIEQNVRGKGVGNKLIEAVEEYAQSHNCDYIELLTLNSRRKDGTHNFYEKLGYQDQNKNELTYFAKMLKETL